MGDKQKSQSETKVSYRSVSWAMLTLKKTTTEPKCLLLLWRHCFKYFNGPSLGLSVLITSKSLTTGLHKFSGPVGIRSMGPSEPINFRSIKTRKLYFGFVWQLVLAPTITYSQARVNPVRNFQLSRQRSIGGGGDISNWAVGKLRIARELLP